MSTVTAQWGVRLTWPGRTEVVAQDSREGAESFLRLHASRGRQTPVAELVVRAVNGAGTTEWQAAS